MTYTDEVVPIPEPDLEAEPEDQPRDETEGNDPYDGVVTQDDEIKVVP